MSEELTATQILQDPTQIQVLRIILIIVLAWLLRFLIDRSISWLAERIGGRVRLYLLPSVPVLKLMVLIVAIGLIIPLLVKPTIQNLAAILGALALAIGFGFKDYVSSVIAGIIALFERPYRPGDWVEIDGAYGEVRTVSMRALRILTPDDTIVTIPQAKLWDTNIYNANDGQRDLMCVVDFYLEPDHDAQRVRQILRDVALTSPYLQLERPLIVVVAERPWGTHYRLKAYPIDGRDQFQFTSDLTVRGKTVLADIGARPASAWAAGRFD